MLAVRELPEHGDAVLATRGAERTIGRDSDRVDVASVAVVVGLQLALAELPNLQGRHGEKRTEWRTEVNVGSDSTRPTSRSGLDILGQQHCGASLPFPIHAPHVRRNPFVKKGECSVILVTLRYSHRAMLSIVANI